MAAFTRDGLSRYHKGRVMFPRLVAPRDPQSRLEYWFADEIPPILSHDSSVNGLSGSPVKLLSFPSQLISTLESRARAADVMPKPVARRQTQSAPAQQAVSCTNENPFYDVLYAYYVRRLKFHSAASLCFEQAIRLAEESAFGLSSIGGMGRKGKGGAGSRALAVLQRQAFCLTAAINSLEMLPPESQWLIKPDSKVRFADELLDSESAVSVYHRKKLGVYANKMIIFLLYSSRR